MSSSSMVIVIGTFKVAPEDREAFIADKIEGMKRSRAEQGCITYTFGGDPLDPGVVVLTERWADRAAIDAHLAAMRSGGAPAQTIKVLESEITFYEASAFNPR